MMNMITLKNINKIAMMVALLLLSTNLDAQIIVNGPNPSRWGASAGPKNSLSISYGNVLWIDGKNTPLAGYSASRAMFHMENAAFNADKYNASYGVVAGYEKNLSNYLSLRLAFSYARLFTGIAVRPDLVANDQSKISQLGLYGRYSLTKNLEHRLQFQWLAGPELIYAQKNVLVNEYLTDENGTPQNYMHDVTVMEGALVSGLGISLRVAKQFSLFSDIMGGITFPGTTLKLTNSGMGLKYTW